MQSGSKRRQVRPWWWTAAVVALTAASAAPTARGAEKAVAVENLRIGFAASTRNNLFKIGNWNPVWVRLRGGSERFSGILEVEVPDDDGTPTYVRQAVDVPPNSSARVTTHVRPGSRDPNVTIRLFEHGRTRPSLVVDGSTLARLDPVRPEEMILLTVGSPQGVEQVPDLPGFKSDPTAGNRDLIVVRPEAEGGMLPGRWYGYDAVEAVVVDTNDKDAMTELGARGQALVDWVARGGHLVVAVGGNWASVRDSVLGPILPGLPDGQERLSALDLKTLDMFAGAVRSIANDAPPSVMVARLDQVESRGGKVLSASGDVPLVVRGSYRFGRVTLVAFDVDQKPFSTWPDRALFWTRALDLRPPSLENADANVQVGVGVGRIYQSGVSDLATQLRMALEQFPGVKLVPFGWVAFFIFLYILLIGPGDYFFLKRVVKRMELTWATFPLIVLTVSLLAYFAAYLVKGKELRINKVDVVDLDLASGLARGSTFFNLFSPQNRDYDVRVVPLSLEQTTAPGQPAAPGAKRDDAPEPDTNGSRRRIGTGTDVLTTWMGVPESGFGGMGGNGRVGFSAGGYASTPVGSLEAIEGVRVPIWSTKLLTARWFGPASAAADADLIPVGTDRLSGTIANRLGVPLRDAIVAFGKHVYMLGDVAPGETKRVELAPDRQLSGLLKARYSGAAPDGLNAGERINRPDLMLALMFHDSQGTATTDRPLASTTLHSLDLTGLLALDRPMLVGWINRPAATLILGNAPAPPRVEQTTMLRVILPLGKPPGEEGEAK